MTDSAETAARSNDAETPAIDDLLARRSSRKAPSAGAETIAALLATLDFPEPVSSDADRRLLVDVTFARVLRARDEQAALARLNPEPLGPTLSTQDADALDAMIGDEWSTGANERTRRAHSLLSLLDVEPAASDAERRRLVSTALTHVQSDMDAQADRLKFQPIERPAFIPSAFRWREIGAIAAMLLIAVSIFWPMVNGIRVEAGRALAQSNLQQSSLGFGMFGADHDDQLPAVGSHGPDGLWWQVGNPEKSHSANLYTLVRTHYVPIQALASPGNPNAPTEVSDSDAMDWNSNEEVSYSYQLFGKIVPHLTSFDGRSRVLLADRSPLVDRARMGLPLDPRANSANNAGIGQFVLLSDGEVRFLRTPELDGDNIWLPRRLEAISRPQVFGTELPASRDDAFVGP